MADELYQDYLTGGDIVPASFSMEIGASGGWPALPELSWREFGAWLLRRRSRHRIEGHSMLPLLQPGDEVLYQPRLEQSLLQLGDIVIAHHPDQADLVMIKRIGAVEGASEVSGAPGEAICDRYFLLGDNRAASTDSRSFGWVGRSQLIGIVTCRFSEQ